MDLGKEALNLLMSARRADSAPLAARHRVKKRLVSAIAAGTVGVSAVVAKGASMGGIGTAAHVGAGVGAGSSLAGSVLGAVATGLALGLVAITPAGKRTEDPFIAPSLAATGPARAIAPDSLNRAILTAPSSSSEPSEPPSALPAMSSPVPTVGSGSVASQRVAQGPQGQGDHQHDPEAAVSARNVDVAVPHGPVPADGSVGVMPASKASIARETEMLAAAQRALQQGRPATALSILNRYWAQFPDGELREESVASRVVALCDFGRRDDAEHWRAEFFRRYPSSPLSARVRAACQSAATTATSGPVVPK